MVFISVINGTSKFTEAVFNPGLCVFVFFFLVNVLVCCLFL